MIVDEPHRADPLAELDALAIGIEPFESVLGDLVTVAARVLAPGGEASVTLLRADVATTAASTSEVARGLDERQYAQGAGPCFDSASGGASVVIADMSDEKRWPAFAELARDAGMASSMAVPLPIQREVTGALNIYSPDRGAFDDGSVELAQTFASYAAVALANAQRFSSAVALAAQMREAMATRAVIEQAKGIVMRDRGCSPDEAFEALVKLSQDMHIKLRTIAQRLVDHTSGADAADTADGTD
jgi:GAF domain-containing protein